MKQCYQCDNDTNELSPRGRCVACEYTRSRANEVENESLRVDLAFRTAQLNELQKKVAGLSHVSTTKPLPCQLGQASVIWGCLKAARAIACCVTGLPITGLAYKRHPHDDWNPVTAPPTDYPGSVRFAVCYN